MYFNLALRNIKKSVKDYTIYFITLIFGVCIFYIFNSIESQKIMLDLNESYEKMFYLVNRVMNVASVFVAFILGFLIIYANNYLIKRRKKEFGIYMTLGIENGSLSRIIFCETLIIGAISLGIGLILGILLSQGLSIFTAKLFQVNLKKFTFIFSKGACIRTVICFAVIYLVVLLFNSVSIRKIQLINLLNAGKKNEKAKIKNIKISILVFILSIFCIGCGYYSVIHDGIATVNLLPIIMGAVGTFLFFFSLSGFLLKIAQSNKKNYLKDLNMFVIRQIDSKINTTFISMSFICLMLFISICTLSSGLGMNKALNSDIKDLTKYNMTAWSYDGVDIEEYLKSQGFDFSKYSNEYVNLNRYDSGFSYEEFLSSKAREAAKNYFPVQRNQNIYVVKLSAFNDLLKMLGKEEIKLDKDQYAIYSDVQDIKEGIEESIKGGKSIEVNGKELSLAQEEIIDVTDANSTMKNNLCTFIVDDSIVEGLSVYSCQLNMNYKNGLDVASTNTELDNIFNSIGGEYNIFNISREGVKESSGGLGATVSFLAIYMGVIFLITSAAILAIQQLSESTENVERYNLLRKLGVDESLINKSLFNQIAIYFMLPLALAIIHSIVGLKVASKIVTLFGSGDIIYYILITALILVVIYGGYFLATYNGAKKNIGNNI